MLNRYYKYILSFGLLAVIATVAFVCNIEFLKGLSFWLLLILLLISCGKKCLLQNVSIADMGRKETIVVSLSAILLVLLCTLPMRLSDFWNGNIPMHRNQYEVLADSILEGHLYIDYGDLESSGLLELENPYDPAERIKYQTPYHYDHAFYNGHYYMYFGVVPVFLLFIPFKLIFGKTLVTFHATQFFVGLSVVAFFILFYLIAKKFFPKLSVWTYIISTWAISLISISYCVQAPALYCTAISGGIFFEVWSLLFFFAAVYYAEKNGWQVALATLGALCGALAFGCRPPVALANLIAIPLAITYAKDNKGKHLVKNFIIIALPYVVIGALLMMYNYARFESPFEFGQAYQLTDYDQRFYAHFTERFDPALLLNGLAQIFINVGEISNDFPYITYGGFFVTYPLMWMLLFWLFNGHVQKEIKKNKLLPLVSVLCITAVFVALVVTFWSPGLCERYRLDLGFVMGILLFILMGYRIKTSGREATLSVTISILAVFSILFAFLLFLQPNDANYTYLYPEKLTEVKNILFFIK